MYTFDQYVGSKSRTLTQQNGRLYLSSTSFVCVCAMTSY